MVFSYRRHFLITLAVLVLASVIALSGCVAPPPQAPAEQPTAEPAATEAMAETPAASEGTSLILATTTSTQDSGLLDAILPDFEAASGVDVDVVGGNEGVVGATRGEHDKQGEEVLVPHVQHPHPEHAWHGNHWQLELQNCHLPAAQHCHVVPAL